MEEIRDYVLIVALILLGLLTLVALTAFSLIAWKLLKGVRWARRQHDDRLSPLVAAANERVAAINAGLASGSGVAEFGAGRLSLRAEQAQAAQADADGARAGGAVAGADAGGALRIAGRAVAAPARRD